MVKHFKWNFAGFYALSYVFMLLMVQKLEIVHVNLVSTYRNSIFHITRVKKSINSDINKQSKLITVKFGTRKGKNFGSDVQITQDSSVSFDQT